MKAVFYLAVLITVALLGFGLYQGLVAAPTEQTMGDIQRIFYYHVPSAWTAFILFFANFIASFVYLVTRKGNALRANKADAFALATAEVGIVFTTIVLITGPLWAKPVWGIWWTWDARLTTTLVLWLLYVSYLLLRRFSTSEQTGTLAATLGIFAYLDVPIVYMSIRWWRTQHPQPVIAGGQGSGLDPQMWHAVLWNWLAFSCLAAIVVALRYKLALAERRQQDLEVLRVIGDEHLAAEGRHANA
jgi:heme exporter protein C